MTRFRVLISLALIFTTATPIVATKTTRRAPSSSRRCGNSCRFEICGFQRALISHPSLPITRSVCRRNTKEIGQILSVGEAKVMLRRKRSAVLISRLRLYGRTPFRSNFIFPVRTELTLPNVSSLAVRYLPRRVIENLQSACVKVPITKWIERGVERSGRGCVAFNVQVPNVMVELQWDSNDDLDLFVIEPDGTRVFFQESSGSGRLLRDVGRRNCGNVRRVGGKETVVYFANQLVKKGRYFVSAEHTKNCMESATSWEVRVVVQGRLVRRIGGVSRLREGGVISGSNISFVV